MLGGLRRAIAGCGLILFGVLLARGSMSSGTTAGPVVGLVLLLAGCGAGIAVFAASSWGRIVGLCVSVAGLLIGASLAFAGIDGPLAGMLFSPADAARWYVVMPSGYVYAAISAVAGLLLLAPFGPPEEPKVLEPPDADEPDAAGSADAG